MARPSAVIGASIDLSSPHPEALMVSMEENSSKPKGGNEMVVVEMITGFGRNSD